MDVLELRRDFPILQRRVDGLPLVYLDSAATSLKPTPVIEAVTNHYRSSSSNIHRGKHRLSEEASDAFEDARVAVAGLVGADASQLVFVRNTTEGLALAARALRAGPERRVLVPDAEHHSNVLPWMQAGALAWLPTDANGRINPSEIERAADKRVVAISFALASNVTGAIQPAEDIVRAAKRRGLAVVIDAAQAVPHLPVDFGSLGCDFMAFSSHKMLGPSGVGALIAAPGALTGAEPSVLGGGSIKTVTDLGYTLKDPPYCFESGTPAIEATIGFGVAARYLAAIGMAAVRDHGRHQAEMLLAAVAEVPRVRVIGPSSADERIGLATVAFDDPHVAADVVAMTLSDSFAICVRSGTLCAQPYFRKIGVGGALRASAFVYTTDDELALFARRLGEVVRTVL